MTVYTGATCKKEQVIDLMQIHSFQSHCVWEGVTYRDNQHSHSHSLCGQFIVNNRLAEVKQPSITSRDQTSRLLTVRQEH